GTPLSDQMPEIYLEVDKNLVYTDENEETMANGSLAAALNNKQLMRPEAVVHPKQQIYGVAPILLMTVAAIVNGAETCNAIAQWGFQNEELLLRFRLPEASFPDHSTLRKIFVKINIDSFESVLEMWLRETFPLIGGEMN